MRTQRYDHLFYEGIEFSFRFTYPETIKAIADSCDQLLYLKLHRFNRITTSLHRPGIGGMVSAILNATAVGRGDRAVRGANAANRAAAVATAIINEAVGVANGEETHSDDEVDAAPTTATAATSSSSSPKSNHQEFLASSPECKALIYFGKKGPKTLRMLDICGNIGLTDWTLSQMKCCGSSLHTFFVEGNPNLSSTGLIRFAEHRWKFLKRINARNCPKVSFNVVQENYLSKGLEIEVTVDGGKRV